MNPHAMPTEMEHDKIIMIIVINTEAATILSSQFTSFNCTIIKIPTITNADAVTDAVNNDNTKGAKNIDKKKHMPTTIAVNPVLPPNSNT